MTSTRKKAEKALLVEPEKWACSVKGCEVDTQKGICRHLEKKLPQMGDERFTRISQQDAARATKDFFSIMHPTWSRERFIELLRQYGITEGWDLDLLEARYFDRHTMVRIKELFNYPNKMIVYRRLKYLHSLLVERGFEKEIQ